MRRLEVAILILTVCAAGTAGAAPKKKSSSAKSEPAKAASSVDLPLEELDATPASDELDLELPPTPAAKPAEAPAPVAAPPPPPPPAPVAEETPAPVGARMAIGEKLRVTPVTSFGYVGESAVGAAMPTFGMALQAEYFLNPEMSIALDVGDQFYRRSYLARRPALGGAGLARTDVDEQRIAVDALFGWEMLPTFGVTSPSVSFAALAGPSLRFFENAAFANQAGGIALGARGGFALADTLDVSAHATWAYNVFFKNEALTSALGAPVAVSTMGAAVGLRLSPGTRLRLGYEGEIATLAASYRLLHTLAFSFDIAR